jgi:hypothetical protein
MPMESVPITTNIVGSTPAQAITWLYDVSSVWGNVGGVMAVIVYNMLLELHVITLQRPYIISKL